jgi:hypothetical protein
MTAIERFSTKRQDHISYLGLLKGVAFLQVSPNRKFLCTSLPVQQGFIDHKKLLINELISLSPTHEPDSVGLITAKIKHHLLAFAFTPSSSLSTSPSIEAQLSNTWGKPSSWE